jgi:hypothetical protein
MPHRSDGVNFDAGIHTSSTCRWYALVVSEGFRVQGGAALESVHEHHPRHVLVMHVRDAEETSAVRWTRFPFYVLHLHLPALSTLPFLGISPQYSVNKRKLPI